MMHRLHSIANAFGRRSSPRSSPSSSPHLSSRRRPRRPPTRKTPSPGTETGAGKSYVVPGLETIGFLFLLNQYDRHFQSNKGIYRTGFDNFWDHLTDGKWVVDKDRFPINQFLHPYSGSVYYGFARSAGLDLWQSLLYAEAGSFLWELGGETTTPSINDQLFTPIGGSFLGESLFRMGSLLLESGGSHPAWWREVGAAAISPPLGFNRLAFGNRFDAVYPSHHPAVFARLQVGYAFTQSSHNISGDVKRHGAIGSIYFDYGLPGRPGYTYDRPFDYFDFELHGVTTNAVETLLTRGLLLGTTYSFGDATRGVWGLYGSYDYVSPQVFRVSTIALSAGTTWQSWLSRRIALQGTALVGAGYGGAGRTRRLGDRDYHYGTTPQALLGLRLILGDRVMLGLACREYYVSDLFAPEPHGWENIARGDASLTVRVWGHHGIALRYALSHRDARYALVSYKNQTIGMVNVEYAWLGQTDLGAVDWR